MVAATPAWRAAGEAKQDTDEFLDAFNRGCSAKTLQRMLHGFSAPRPRGRQTRLRTRTIDTRSPRRARQVNEDKENIAMRLSALEEEVFVKARSRDFQLRRRMQAASSATSALRNSVAEQDIKIEQQRLRQASAAAAAAALKSRLETLEALAAEKAESEARTREQGDRLQERFAELQRQQARLSRHHGELAASVRELPRSLHLGDACPPRAASTSATQGSEPLGEPATLPSQSLLPGAVNTDGETPLRPGASVSTSGVPRAMRPTDSGRRLPSPHPSHVPELRPHPQTARRSVLPPPPPEPPHVTISQAACADFLARHANRAACTRPVVHTLCEQFNTFSASLRQPRPLSAAEATGPSDSGRRRAAEAATPVRRPSSAGPRVPSSAAHSIAATAPATTETRGRGNGRKARRGVKVAAPKACASAPAAVIAHTATDAVSYDVADPSAASLPAISPLALGAQRRARQHLSSGRLSMSDDDDDDDDDESLPSSALQQRYRRVFKQ